MAATIHINSNSLWSAGTLAFGSIVEGIREHCDYKEQLLFGEVFSPLDQGFNFIVLNELDKQDFQLFYRKASDTYQDHSKGSIPYLPDEYYMGVLDCWREFMELLEKDKRLD